MNALPLFAAALAVATVLSCSACRAQQPVLCSDKASSAPVYVQIDTTTPVPTVTPKACHVMQGASITWVADTTAFSLRFKDAGNPGGKGMPKEPTSSPSSNGKQQYNVNARGNEGTYDYDVIVAGKAMDPAIIIKK
ncbi:hypothetical protein [Lysobacter soli]|jgi:hypothetical protein|uniref:Uncharacterized protein n=1 Tax=Lysobacter soli TaxID=453783 RepID=A0A3D8VJZ8_9GAMM|nr:hypothetical protein [Lysobacter soli]RDY69623.1 hypothetical protein DX912_02445 [Lysobacter soli]